MENQIEQPRLQGRGREPLRCLTGLSGFLPIILRRLRWRVRRLIHEAQDSTAAVDGAKLSAPPTDQRTIPTMPPTPRYVAFLGFPYADGVCSAFPLIARRDGNLLSDQAFRRAFRAVTHWLGEEGRRELVLECAGLRPAFSLVREATRRSLDPTPYVANARVWATCTPIVLDRHLKEIGNEARDAEIAGLIRRACVNIGLPEPELVAPDKHSAVEGAASAYPSGRAPAWTRWRLPPSLANRQLTHVVLQFEHPVRGPVILGVLRHRRGTPRRAYIKGLICLCEFQFLWGRDRRQWGPYHDPHFPRFIRVLDQF
jgi:CRISPR-associated protein Csb2